MAERKVVLHINELLSKNDLTLRELARRSGIEPSNLSNLANGKRKRICLEHIERITNALEIDDLGEILGLQIKNNMTCIESKETVV